MTSSDELVSAVVALNDAIAFLEAAAERDRLRGCLEELSAHLEPEPHNLTHGQAVWALQVFGRIVGRALGVAP